MYSLGFFFHQHWMYFDLRKTYKLWTRTKSGYMWTHIHLFSMEWSRKNLCIWFFHYNDRNFIDFNIVNMNTRFICKVCNNPYTYNFSGGGVSKIIIYINLFLLLWWEASSIHGINSWYREWTLPMWSSVPGYISKTATFESSWYPKDNLT